MMATSVFGSTGILFCLLLWYFARGASAQSDSSITVLVRSPVATLSEATNIIVYRGDVQRSVTFDKARLKGSGLDSQYLQFRNNNLRVPSEAIIDHNNEPATLMLPDNMTTAERTGIYSITVTGDDGTETVLKVLITYEDADVTAAEYSTVVSQGDNVTLRAVLGDGVDESSLRWRRDGDFQFHEGYGAASFSVFTAQNSEVLECFVAGTYAGNVHAIMNLIVRSCPDSKTGPGCMDECPRCFNGGVCSSETVSCLCPPGFSGDHCQNVHGSNVFGQNAEYKCNDTADDHGDGCEGAIICYPEPFGCICSAGYTGIDCMLECTDGKFGANCKQDCHCQGGVSCAKDTGECPNNQCAEGWKGINCQVENPCAAPWIGEACDEHSGVGMILNVTYVKVNPGVSTSVTCSAIRNPVLDEDDLELMSTASFTFSVSDVDEETFTRSNTWMVTLQSDPAVMASCTIGGTTVSQSLALAPYELLQYSDGRMSLLSFSAVTSTSMIVTWLLWDPSMDVGDGPIKEYLIEYREEGGSFTQAVRTLTGSSHEVTNLKADTLYEFRIVLVREGPNGDGPPSDIQSQRTLCGSFTMSPSLTLEFLNARTATFQIEIPPSNHWSCRSITATLQRQQSDGQWIEEMHLATVSGTVDVRNLLPCSSYTFRVQVANGQRIDTSQSLEITSQPEALVVRGLTVSAATTGQLSVSWQPPDLSQTNCVVKMYTVIYHLVRHIACTSDVMESANMTETTASTSITLNNLSDYAEYDVIVRADGEVAGTEIREVGITTLPAAPSGAPVNITLTNISSTCLEFSWEPPLCIHRNGEITKYQYSLNFFNGTSNDTAVSESPTEVTDVLLCSLTPYVEYFFKVKASTLAGPGPDSEIVIERTQEDVPPQLDPPNIPFRNTSSLQIVWEIPNPPHGVITTYDISGQLLGDGQSNMSFIVSVNAGDAGDPPSYVLGDLLASRNYSVMIRANTRIGPGNWSSPVTSNTIEGLPSSPQNLLVSEKSKSQITVEWDIPKKPRGNIIVYEISYQAEEKPYILNFQVGAPNPKNISSTDLHITYNLTSLEPSTVYRVEVSAYTSAGQGDISSISEHTDIADEFTAVKMGDIQRLTREGMTATIILPPLIEIYATHYVVRVKVSLQSKRSVGGIGSYEDDPSDYITAEIQKSDKEVSFKIGDGKQYGMYQNVPLEESKEYEIYVGTGSRVGEDAEVVWSEPFVLSVNASPWIAIVIVVVVLAIFVVLLAGVVLIKRRGKKETDFKDDAINPAYMGDEVVSASPSQKEENKAIKVANLALYVKQKKESPTDNFIEEYKTLPDDQLYPWDVGSKEQNNTKNRYRNIIPYDYARVVLDIVDGDPHSDYFNASYVDGYNAPNKFIASHGPNKASVVDFWRMIWQEDCGKIVMVTPLKEEGKKKCEKYWPDDFITYGNIVVVCKSVEETPTYTLRTFFVSTIGATDSRTVRHFHFTAWRDMKVPESPDPLLEFLQVVRKEPNPRTGPTVVHCSAGVGRTGTYITLDAMMDMAAAEKKVNVYQWICEMRQRRIKMVQVPEQYEFIFDALVKFLVVGNTSLPVESFRLRLGDLKKISQRTKQSYLHDQFKNLNIISVAPDQSQLSGAKEPENQNKNRFPMVLPVDSHRPLLMTEVDGGGNAYINASFVNGFGRRDMFLAAQMPLENTVLDFWRLVWDYNSNVIVMLNDMPLKSSEQYWPDSGTVTFGPFIVQLCSRDEDDNLVVSKLEICNTALKYQNFRTILHLRCLGWPEHDVVPPSPYILLNLVSKVNTWQLENEAGPILVHCIDGIGRTGIFCALISAIDQAKAEQKVDIFQIIHNMRKARPNIVPNVEQYQCILDTFLARIENLSTYENLEI